MSSENTAIPKMEYVRFGSATGMRVRDNYIIIL